jgi:hypothetical protein
MRSTTAAGGPLRRYSFAQRSYGSSAMPCKGAQVVILRSTPSGGTRLVDQPHDAISVATGAACTTCPATHADKRGKTVMAVPEPLDYEVT